MTDVQLTSEDLDVLRRCLDDALAAAAHAIELGLAAGKPEEGPEMQARFDHAADLDRLWKKLKLDVTGAARPVHDVFADLPSQVATTNVYQVIMIRDFDPHDLDAGEVQAWLLDGNPIFATVEAAEAFIEADAVEWSRDYLELCGLEIIPQLVWGRNANGDTFAYLDGLEHELWCATILVTPVQGGAP